MAVLEAMNEVIIWNDRLNEVNMKWSFCFPATIKHNLQCLKLFSNLTVYLCFHTLTSSESSLSSSLSGESGPRRRLSSFRTMSLKFLTSFSQELSRMRMSSSLNWKERARGNVTLACTKMYYTRWFWHEYFQKRQNVGKALNFKIFFSAVTNSGYENPTEDLKKLIFQY